MLKDSPIMNNQKKIKEMVGEIVHHFCRKPKANDSFWHIFNDEEKEGMYRFVGWAIYVINNRYSPKWIHNYWLDYMGKCGVVYGESKTNTTHPFLVDFEDLPPEQRLKLGILYDFTKRVMEYWDEKEKLESET